MYKYKIRIYNRKIIAFLKKIYNKRYLNQQYF